MCWSSDAHALVSFYTLPARRVIQATKGNDHKISILLNKADNVTTQQLMRVYGALDSERTETLTDLAVASWFC